MSRTSLLLALWLVVGNCGSARADDWPHWRGATRNGLTSEESGWQSGVWPLKEPAWRASVGIGATSPIVVGDRVYVLGWADQRDTLTCLDARSGRIVWRQGYPAPRHARHAAGDEGLYAGITPTPEYDAGTGLLYSLSVDGELICWDVRSQPDGEADRIAWQRNLYDDFGAPQRDRIGRSGRRDYGYTTAPLLHAAWVLVEVGSPQGNLMAFDKRTGRQLWSSQSKDQAGHTGGLAPLTVEGLPCAAVWTLRHLLVVRLDPGHEGETLGQFPWETEYAQHIATPAVHENKIVITSGYNHESVCLLEAKRDGLHKRWEQRAASLVCSPVIHRGYVYWVHQEPVCLELATGRVVWKGPRQFGDAGSCLITSDDRLIMFTDRGRITLAETAMRSPRTYRELSRTDSLFQTEVWPHVVLAGRRLIVKDRDGRLACFRWGESQ